MAETYRYEHYDPRLVDITIAAHELADRLDGAVAEICQDASGYWHAEIRIPAPEPQ